MARARRQRWHDDGRRVGGERRTEIVERVVAREVAEVTRARGRCDWKYAPLDGDAAS